MRCRFAARLWFSSAPIHSNGPALAIHRSRRPPKKRYLQTPDSRLNPYFAAARRASTLSVFSQLNSGRPK